MPALLAHFLVDHGSILGVRARKWYELVRLVGSVPLHVDACEAVSTVVGHLNAGLFFDGASDAETLGVTTLFGPARPELAMVSSTAARGLTVREY
jgi:hypothetical protein